MYSINQLYLFLFPKVEATTNHQTDNKHYIEHYIKLIDINAIGTHRSKLCYIIQFIP